MREEILRLLEKNSRIDIKEIAILVGKTEAEVANEIAQMEKEGIIRGYYTLINWDKIAERISKFDEVKSVYLMSGGFDFTVILEEKTMKEIAQFVTSKLSTLDEVLNTATHFVLKKYKDYGVTMMEEHKDERMLVTP